MPLYRLTYSYDAVSSTHDGYVRQEATAVIRTYGPTCATLILEMMVYDQLRGRNLTVHTLEEVTEAMIAEDERRITQRLDLGGFLAHPNRGDC